MVGSPGTAAEPRRGRSGVRGRGATTATNDRCVSRPHGEEQACAVKNEARKHQPFIWCHAHLSSSPPTPLIAAPHDWTGDESNATKEQELGPSEARRARGLPRAPCVVNHGRCGSGFTWHCGLSYQVTVAVFLGCSLCVREEGSTPRASVVLLCSRRTASCWPLLDGTLSSRARTTLFSLAVASPTRVLATPPSSLDACALAADPLASATSSWPTPSAATWHILCGPPSSLPLG